MPENHEIVVDTTGSAGAATGSATNPFTLSGIIHRISLVYNGSAPVTTKVVVSYDLPNGETVTLVDVTGNTDIDIVPTFVETDEAGLSTGGRTPVVVAYETITVAVTLSDALTGAVTATITMA
jgi:hypothetical protein